jgi:DNA-binding MarR family transcriptional regulator
MSSDQQLQNQIMEFIRAFGLLEPDRTPCGEPISVSAAHALTELAGVQGLSQSDLGSRLRLEKSTVSRLAADLEQKGWIERRRDTADGRIIRLHLTEQGLSVSERVVSARAALFTKLTEHISSRERLMVERALDVLVRAVSESKEP